MEEIKIARLALARKCPYFEPGLWSMRLVVTEEVPTMAVDEGWRLYANPKWTAERTPKELVGLLWHELEHLLRRYHERGRLVGALGNQANPHLARVWNLAADCAINDDAAAGRFTLPPEGVFPKTFGLEEGLSDEEYYRELLQMLQTPNLPGDMQQDGSGSPQGVQVDLDSAGSLNSSGDGHQPGNGQEQSAEGSGDGAGGTGTEGTGQPGGGRDEDPLQKAEKGLTDTHAAERPWERPMDDAEAPGLSRINADVVRKEVARRVIEHARSRGNVPGGLLRWAEEIYQPSVSWQRLLRHEVRQGLRPVLGRTRSTYERLHRRHAVYARMGVHLPGS